MNNRVKKRDIKYEEYNDNKYTSKKLKIVTNNKENDLYISSSEIKKLIKNSNIKKLKNIFDISKFYDNEFIKSLLFLYKNKTPTKNLNYEISKDKYKIILVYEKENNFYNKNNYIIDNENKNLLKYLVEHEVDINKVVYKNDKIPLFDACQSGNKDLVKYLVEHGADINKENEDIETPLFKAIESKNKGLVKYLVEHGADVNKENKYGKGPLFKAIESGNKNLVEYLVEEHKVDINKENWNGETPLLKAIENGEKDLIEYLVDNGADINKRMNVVRHHYLMHAIVGIKI